MKHAPMKTARTKDLVYEVLCVNFTIEFKFLSMIIDFITNLVAKLDLHRQVLCMTTEQKNFPLV